MEREAVQNMEARLGLPLPRIDRGLELGRALLLCRRGGAQRVWILWFGVLLKWTSIITLL